MEQSDFIIVEKQKAVATIWLNRPEKHNALNSHMIALLTETIKAFSLSNEIRVVVIRGKGKSFCAGADLNYMIECATFDQKENQTEALRLAQLFESIYTSPKAIIAVLHGAVYGGANGIAAAADIVLADHNAVFSFSEIKLGLTPATISPYVIRRCSETMARELMLTGRRFSTTEAHRYLLVNQITTAENQENMIQEYIKHLLTSAPLAIEQCKKLIRDISASSQTTLQLMPLTSSQIAEQRASIEGREGLNAFIEKRKPNWITE